MSYPAARSALTKACQSATTLDRSNAPGMA
jgi:hypothetical protein